MIYLPTGKIIPVEWSILRGTSMEEENFSRADIAVFLVGCRSQEGYKKPLGRLRQGYTETELPFEIDGGVLSFDIPDFLQEGVYGLKAVWIKDGFKRMQSEKMNCFAISNDETLTNKVAGSLRIKTGASTYGYDGLDSYELAVLRGKTSLSLDEWCSALDVISASASEAISNANESGKYAEQQAKAAQAAAETASKFVNPTGITIDNETYIMTFNGQQYLLTPYVKKPWKDPDEQKVVDEIIWGTPVITELTYDSQLPAAGGTIRTRDFHYSQQKTTIYESNHANEYETITDDSKAIIEWGGIAQADGSFILEANKSGKAIEYTVKVRVTINDVTSDWYEVSLVQPSATKTTIEYSNLKLNLSYPVASNAGQTVMPTFTYSVDRKQKYNIDSIEDVLETETGEVTSSMVTEWSNNIVSGTFGHISVPINTEVSLTDKKVCTVTAKVDIHGIKVNDEYPVASADVYQKSAAKTVTSVEYNMLSVSLTYRTVPPRGGDAEPILSYSYYKITNYNNGDQDKTKMTSGGTVVYKDKSSQAVITNGKFQVPATQSATSVDVRTVEVTVTVGEGDSAISKTAEFTVKQAGTGIVTEDMWVGTFYGVPNDDSIIEENGMQMDAKEGDVTVTTQFTDEKNCHFVAFKKDSTYSVYKAKDIDGDDLTDDLVSLSTTKYKVYFFGQRGYINNLTVFTIIKS